MWLLRFVSAVAYVDSLFMTTSHELNAVAWIVYDGSRPRWSTNWTSRPQSLSNLPSHGMVVDSFVVTELQIRIWRRFNAARVLDLKAISRFW